MNTVPKYQQLFSKYVIVIHNRRNFRGTAISFKRAKAGTPYLNNYNSNKEHSKLKGEQHSMPKESINMDKTATNSSANVETQGDRDIKQELESTYRMNRPRDILDGTIDCMVNLASGVISGTVTFFKCTVQGAYTGAMIPNGGVFGATIGFFEGILKGSLGGGIMIISGVIAAGNSFVRGVVNTPESLRFAMNGNHSYYYDKSMGRWVTYNLVLESEKLLHPNALNIYLKQLQDDMGMEQYHEEMQYYNRTSEEESYDTYSSSNDNHESSERKRTAVKDDEYYKLLDVASTASSSEIKQAYYKKAKQYHPDAQSNGNNSSNNNNVKMFQKIHNIYQILSNPSLRKVYDNEGKRGVKHIMNNTTSINRNGEESDGAIQDLSATVLYSVIFGKSCKM